MHFALTTTISFLALHVLFTAISFMDEEYNSTEVKACTQQTGFAHPGHNKAGDGQFRSSHRVRLLGR